MSVALDGASAAALRAIAAALRNGQVASPLSALALARAAPGCSEPAVREIVRLSSEGMRPEHLALLLEAVAGTVEGRLANRAELVWTGPESDASHSRDTAVVVAELFRAATKSVLVSTFVLHQVETVFRALAERMADVPDLRVQLFVHVGRRDGDTRDESEVLREYSSRLRKSWPGSTRPALYYDPRSLRLKDDERAAWHAKVVIVDDEIAFLTSANLTEWAQQRNVEAGVLIRDESFARQLRHQFEGLVQSRAVLEVPGFRS